MKMPAAIMSRRPLSTLGEQVLAGHTRLIREPFRVAYPHHWQVPAATEKAAWEAVQAAAVPADFEYWAFPWATIIDGLRGETNAATQILSALGQAIETAPPIRERRRVTVAQHIHALEFLEIFKAAGITDLFWSHATHRHLSVEGIRLHPFPLFPAQAVGEHPAVARGKSRRYLANFIGAYNPQLYLTNVRDVIFNDPNPEGDLLIVKRGAWHFDRAVYEEQIRGHAPDKDRLRVEERHAREYVDAIRDSWFTLCPSGSGPNSIRIFESLALGSIPIVLTRELRLAGPPALWERAAIIEDDSVRGYEAAKAAARTLSLRHRNCMLAAGQELYGCVRPAAYASLIGDAILAVPSSSAVTAAPQWL